MLKLYFTHLLLLTLIISIKVFPQEEFSNESFLINLDDNILLVEDIEGAEIYSKSFFNPFPYLVDLDNDRVNEFLIRDKNESGPEYLLYIYNLLDTFYLSAEINSGITEPFHTTTGELEGLIIVTGNSDFSYLSAGNEVKSLPVNCWKYEDGEIYSVNEEIYEIFITENENLLVKLESEENDNCSRTEQLKALMASVYINYLNAGEKTSAENFLRTFYLCEDLNSFKEELDNIFMEYK